VPIKPGLYEQLVTMALQQELSQLDNRYQRILSPMDPGESHAVLARHMEIYLSGLMSRIKGESKLTKQISLCNELISTAWNAIEKNLDCHDRWSGVECKDLPVWDRTSLGKNKLHL